MGGLSDKTKLILISTIVEVVVEVELGKITCTSLFLKVEEDEILK